MFWHTEIDSLLSINHDVEVDSMDDDDIHKFKVASRRVKPIQAKKYHGPRHGERSSPGDLGHLTGRKCNKHSYMCGTDYRQ